MKQKCVLLFFLFASMLSQASPLSASKNYLHDNSIAIRPGTKNKNAKNGLQNWLDFYKLTLTKFSLSDKYKIDSLISSSITGDFENDYNDIYKIFAIEAPGKEKYVDIYSYSYPALNEKEGKIYASYINAGQEINLVDRKTQTKKRVLLNSEECIIEDAFWIDDTNLVLVGFNFDKDRNAIPSLITFNVSNLEYQLFNYQQPVKKQISYAKDVKLRSLVINN